MSTTNGEKDSLLGQTVLPPELGKILGGLVFFTHPLLVMIEAFLRLSNLNLLPACRMGLLCMFVDIGWSLV